MLFWMFIIVLNQFKKREKNWGRQGSNLAGRVWHKPTDRASAVLIGICQSPPRYYFDPDIKWQWRTSRGAPLLSLIVAHPERCAIAKASGDLVKFPLLPRPDQIPPSASPIFFPNLARHARSPQSLTSSLPLRSLASIPNRVAAAALASLPRSPRRTAPRTSLTARPQEEILPEREEDRGEEEQEQDDRAPRRRGGAGAGRRPHHHRRPPHRAGRRPHPRR